MFKIKNKFGSNLKHLREVKGVEQEDIAKLVGLKSTSGISEWEKGLRLPNIGKLALIADYFNCTIDDLVNKDLTVLSLSEYEIKKANKIYEDNEFRLYSKTRKIKKSYEPIFGEQLLTMTEKSEPSRDEMIEYLKDLPISAFGKSTNIYNMDDEELYEIYKTLKEDQEDN